MHNRRTSTWSDAAVPSIKRRAPSTASTLPWSDLPDDLLGTVYSSLASHLDRTRFAAVSRQWRVAAAAMRRTAPPPLPWLLFASARDDDDDDNNKVKHLYSPVDDKVFRVPVPTPLAGKAVLGSHDGGWVVAAAAGRQGPLSIVNLFTGAEVGLSPEQRKGPRGLDGPCVVRNIIFSEPPTSSTCILAANTGKHGVALCKVGFPGRGGWTTEEGYPGREPLASIAFCNGDLYGLTAGEDLIHFEIGTGKDGSPVLAATPHLLPIQRRGHPTTALVRCVVELHGELALVVRAAWVEWYKPFFKVFKLADAEAMPNLYEWVEVTSLGDYALFVGRTWSKPSYVPAGWHNGVRRNCIYYDDAVYVTSFEYDGGVSYVMQDESVGDGIKSAGSSVASGPRGDTWIAPPDF